MNHLRRQFPVWGTIVDVDSYSQSVGGAELDRAMESVIEFCENVDRDFSTYKEVCIKPASVADNSHTVINCCIEPTYIKNVKADNILPMAISFSQFQLFVCMNKFL